MTASAPCAADRLGELEAVTRDYARYSRSAGGVVWVLGGVLCLLAYAAGAVHPQPLALRFTLMALPLVWLLAGQLLRRRYYQHLGHVEERPTVGQRRQHVLSLAVTLLVAVAVTVSVWPHAWHAHGAERMGSIGYLLLVWALPLATWRWLRSPLDFIVGVFLFCQGALAAAGTAYPLIGTTHAMQATLMSLVALMFPLAAVAMIVAGIRQHRRFQSLRMRLARLRATDGAAG